MNPNDDPPTQPAKDLGKLRSMLRTFDPEFVPDTPADLTTLTQRVREWFDTQLREWYVSTIARQTRPPEEVLFPEFRATITPHVPHGEQRLREQVERASSERERYKTQLIFLHRQLLELQTRLEEAQRQVARLEKQNDGQLDCISGLVDANVSLQQALIEQERGRLCMHEASEGIVTRRLDDGVVVEFDTPEGAREELFEDRQFLRGRTPDEGDHVEAHVFVWQRPHTPAGVERYLTAEEIQRGFPGFQTGVERAKKRFEQGGDSEGASAASSPADPGDRMRPR